MKHSVLIWLSDHWTSNVRSPCPVGAPSVPRRSTTRTDAPPASSDQRPSLIARRNMSRRRESEWIRTFCSALWYVPNCKCCRSDCIHKFFYRHYVHYFQESSLWETEAPAAVGAVQEIREKQSSQERCEYKYKRYKIQIRRRIKNTKWKNISGELTKYILYVALGSWKLIVSSWFFS